MPPAAAFSVCVPTLESECNPSANANWLQQQVLEGAQEKSLKMMSQSFVIFAALDELWVWTRIVAQRSMWLAASQLPIHKGNIVHWTATGWQSEDWFQITRLCAGECQTPVWDKTNFLYRSSFSRRTISVQTPRGHSLWDKSHYPDTFESAWPMLGVKIRLWPLLGETVT